VQEAVRGDEGLTGGDKVIKEDEEAGQDVALIAAAQRVEH
jgi:hypothetical protein